MSQTPNLKMRLSKAGLNLIKSFEAFSPKWYVCPAGKTTIGYGHVKRQGDRVPDRITEAEACNLLGRDAAIAEANIRLLVQVPLTQGQYDALVSFVFNIGNRNFNESTLLRKLNGRDYEGAAKEFGRWVNGGGKPLPGLMKRRAAERAMFEGVA